MQRDPRLKRMHYLALIHEARQSLAKASDPCAQAHYRKIMNGYEELVRRLNAPKGRQSRKRQLRPAAKEPTVSLSQPES